MALSRTTALLEALILQVEGDLGVPHVSVADLKSGGKKPEAGGKGKVQDKKDNNNKEAANKKDNAKQTNEVKDNAGKKSNEKATGASVSGRTERVYCIVTPCVHVSRLLKQGKRCPDVTNFGMTPRVRTRRRRRRRRRRLPLLPLQMLPRERETMLRLFFFSSPPYCRIITVARSDGLVSIHVCLHACMYMQCGQVRCFSDSPPPKKKNKKDLHDMYLDTENNRCVCVCVGTNIQLLEYSHCHKCRHLCELKNKKNGIKSRCFD
jgi:hypothetical protein